jgi:hypothetical protein
MWHEWGEKRNVYRLLVGKPEGKEPLERSSVDGWITLRRLEIEWGGVDWMCLVQDREKFRALVNSVINLRVPQNAGKLSSGCTTGGLSSGTHLDRVSCEMFSHMATDK